MVRIPPRLRNRDSWAWHIGTAVQAWAFLGFWLVSFGVLEPANWIIAGLATTTVIGITAWKNERRRLWRKERELKHAQDNCAELDSQLRELSTVPPPRPPTLVTLTVQAPQVWGPPKDEAEWQFVPVFIQGDSPHDPAAQATGLNLPPGIPWHTPS